MASGMETARSRPMPLRRQLRRWAVPAFAVIAVIVAIYLLRRTLARYSFEEIVIAVQSVPLERILLAAACAAGSYLTLTLFDYFGTRYAGASPPYRRVMVASFAALSIGHNLGFAAVSTGAIRYRFYSRMGLGVGQIAKLVIFCGLTVGLGLTSLIGMALLIRADLASEISGLGIGTLRVIGALALSLVGAYLVLCLRFRRRLHIGHFHMALPPFRKAVIQVAIGSTNFAFVAGCLYHSLAAFTEAGYFAVAAVYVIANASALIAHVPGGLGIIETVVLYMLPDARVIAGLVVFRAVYFLIPLLLGSLLFVSVELCHSWQKPQHRT